MSIAPSKHRVRSADGTDIGFLAHVSAAQLEGLRRSPIWTDMAALTPTVRPNHPGGHRARALRRLFTNSSVPDARILAPSKVFLMAQNWKPLRLNGLHEDGARR
jgi:hypothetical protein